MMNPSPPASSEDLRGVELFELRRETVGEEEVKAQRDACPPVPTVTAEVAVTHVQVTARIANPDGQSRVLFFMPAGYGDSPFEAYLLESEAVRHVPAEAASGPSVSEQFFRVELPAKAVLILRSQVDLGKFTYQGTLEGKITWILRYANWVSRTGELVVRLPPR
jgi:hypothetical protein